MANFKDRVIRAARLDANVYEEVEADAGALGQAVAAVVLSSLAAGIGSAGARGPSGILVGMVFALAGWYIWAYLSYIIGTKILPEPQTKASHGELLRTLGFASSPGIIRVLGIIPGLGGVVLRHGNSSERERGDPEKESCKAENEEFVGREIGRRCRLPPERGV